LNGINVDCTAGQITKNGFEGWFAELQEFQNQKRHNANFGRGPKKKPQADLLGKLCQENSYQSVDKQKKSEFTFQRCKMLVDIGLAPFEYYLYGQEESDAEHEPPVPHADENKNVEEDQYVVDDGDKKLAAI
jgi:hypothetical protein